MSDERWRCFVAIPLPRDLREALAVAVDRWRDRPDLDGLRWTDPDGWHVTLAFLGQTHAAAIPGITAALAEVAGAHPPMVLATGGVGGFGSASRARVAWYGVADVDRRLAALSRGVRAAVSVDRAAPSRGHVTLARARREPVDLRRWVAEASPPTGTLPVETIALMRSHLGRGPARYETLATAMLGAPDDG